MASDSLMISIDLQNNSLSGELLTDVELLIFDTANQMVASGINQFEGELVPGLYRVRSRAFGRSMDKLIEVNSSQTRFDADVPRRTTSLPDGRSIGSHEYYMDEFFSNRNHFSGRVDGSNDVQSLYLFVRTPSSEYARQLANGVPKNLLQGCWLENNDGDSVVEFNDECVVSLFIGVSWFRQPLEPGFYRLCYRDEQDKISWMPIHLFPPKDSNYIFHTEITFLWRDGLRLDTAVMATPWIHLSNNDYQYQLEQTDASLQSLAAGERSEAITLELVNKMLANKFVNPLQGIIACHLMLMRDNPNVANIEQVLSNIANLVAYSPDVEVLSYLLALKKDEKPSLPALKALPLISHQFQTLAVRLLSHKAKSLVNDFISDSSLSMMNARDAQIADYLFYRDLRSPWIKTRPHLGSVFSKSVADKLKKTALNWGRSYLRMQPQLNMEELNKDFDGEMELMQIPDWVINVLKHYKHQNEQKKGNLTKPDFKQLAERYGLPEVLLSFAWDKLVLFDNLKKRLL